jgi:hypothetical protein
MGPHRIIKFKFADQNELSVTINVNTNKIVYLESDWGRSSAGSITDIEGLRFGRTTLKEISDRYGGFGFYFKERGIIRKHETDFLIFNSYEKDGVILSFITRISFNEASGATGGRIAFVAKLEAIVVSDPVYIEGIWGMRSGVIDAEMEGLVPSTNAVTGARKPKPTEIDRFVSYNAFAVAASNAFDKTYKEGGMIKVRTAIEECYLRAHKIKTERSVAYCFMFDYLASLLSEAAASRLGFPVDQFHAKSMMLSRNDQLMRVMKYPTDKRIEVIAEWSKLAADNLLKASSPTPSRSAR